MVLVQQGADYYHQRMKQGENPTKQVIVVTNVELVKGNAALPDVTCISV